MVIRSEHTRTDSRIPNADVRVVSISDYDVMNTFYRVVNDLSGDGIKDHPLEETALAEVTNSAETLDVV